MNFIGLIIGISTFLVIGFFHPVVIKAEYYFGTRCWWVFLVLGLAALTGSVFVTNTIVSTILGVIGFSSFWTIVELFEQTKRVEKGWFPANPKRKNKQK